MILDRMDPQNIRTTIGGEPMGGAPAVPTWLEGTITGVLVAIVLGLIVAMVRGLLKKQSADAGIDDRGAKLQKLTLEQMEAAQAREADLHQRNRELNDRIAELSKQAIEMATTHGRELMAAVNQSRVEHADYAKKQDDAIKRVHAVLDDTKQALVRCEERDRLHVEREQDTENRLAAMERLLLKKIDAATS